MMSDTFKYMLDRFSPKITLLLVFVLVAGFSEFCHLDNKEFFIAWSSTYLILFILRAVDDLLDFKIDKICHPERLLVSGEICPKKLKIALYVSGCLVICLNFFKTALIVVLGIIMIYTIIFYYKDTLPAYLRISLTNVIFLILPAYVGSVGYVSSWIPLVLLGLFIWLSTMAHDVAHSICDDSESKSDVLTLKVEINRHPQRWTLLAIGMFIMAAGTGILFWWYIGRPIIFIALFSLTLSQIFYLSVKLIRNPNYENARPFYIYGFTLFLIPLIGLKLPDLFHIIRNFLYVSG